MNPMTPAFALAILSCLPWIIKAAVYIFAKGKKDGVQEQMSLAQAQAFKRAVDELTRKMERHETITRREVDELVRSVSENTDMANTRYHEFYKEFSDLRFLVGRLMKNGGGTH